MYLGIKFPTLEFLWNKRYPQPIGYLSGGLCQHSALPSLSFPLAACVPSLPLSLVVLTCPDVHSHVPFFWPILSPASRFVSQVHTSSTYLSVPDMRWVTIICCLSTIPAYLVVVVVVWQCNRGRHPFTRQLVAWYEPAAKRSPPSHKLCTWSGYLSSLWLFPLCKKLQRKCSSAGRVSASQAWVQLPTLYVKMKSIGAEQRVCHSSLNWSWDPQKPLKCGWT